jgi:hypothetical protein
MREARGKTPAKVAKKSAKKMRKASGGRGRYAKTTKRQG